MKSCNLCLFVFCLFIILILIILIRFCSYKENFYTKIGAAEPCNEKNFDSKLKNFYKITKKYRDYEKKMLEAQDLYDKNYNLLIKESRKLSNIKNELNNCINY